MKLNTKDLLAALRECHKLIKPRQFVPQLSCVQLTSNGSALSPTLCLRVCDGESWILRLLPVEGEVAEGCISHKRLMLLIELTNAEFTELELNGNGSWLLVKTHAHSTLPVLEAKVFPDFPVTDKKPVAISTLDLAEGIDAVAWAAEDNELLSTRLTNVFVRSETRQLSVYGGSKYSVARFQRGLIGGEHAFGIPAVYARLISKVLREPESKLFLSERFLIAESADGSAAVKLTTERPADYDTAIGLEQYTDFQLVDRALVRKACQHAEALTDDANYPSIEIKWEMLSITFSSGEKEGTGYHFETNGPDGSGWIKCNAKHLHEVLRNMPEGPLKVGTKPNGSCWMVGDFLVGMPQLRK